MDTTKDFLNKISDIRNNYTSRVDVDVTIMNSMSKISGIKIVEFKELVEKLSVEIQSIDRELECFLYLHAIKMIRVMNGKHSNFMSVEGSDEEKLELLLEYSEKLRGLEIWDPIRYINELKNICKQLVKYGEHDIIDRARKGIEICKKYNIGTGELSLYAVMVENFIKMGYKEQASQYVLKIATNDIMYQQQVLDIRYIIGVLITYYKYIHDPKKVKFYEEMYNEIRD